MIKFFDWMNSWFTLAILTCLQFLFFFLMASLLPVDKVLDLRFAYSIQEAYEMIGSLDSETREIYLFVIWALDLPYMFIYGLLFSGLLSKIWKTQKVLILPVSVVLLDFFENLMILKILKIFPLENQAYAIFASFFTTCKWLMIGLTVLTILFGLLHNFFTKKGPAATHSHA